MTTEPSGARDRRRDGGSGATRRLVDRVADLEARLEARDADLRRRFGARTGRRHGWSRRAGDAAPMAGLGDGLARLEPEATVLAEAATRSSGKPRLEPDRREALERTAARRREVAGVSHTPVQPPSSSGT